MFKKTLLVSGIALAVTSPAMAEQQTSMVRDNGFSYTLRVHSLWMSIFSCAVAWASMMVITITAPLMLMSMVTVCPVVWASIPRFSVVWTS